jgi:hypothetical protein
VFFQSDAVVSIWMVANSEGSVKRSTATQAIKLKSKKACPAQTVTRKSLAFNAPERSQPRAVRPAAELEASRHAVTGLIAKNKVSLPVASSVPAHGRDETFFNWCLSRASSPAEHKRPLALPGNSGSLPLNSENECAPMTTCSVNVSVLTIDTNELVRANHGTRGAKENERWNR